MAVHIHFKNVFKQFIPSLVYFLPLVWISWTGEKNAIQTVQVSSSNNVIQTNSRKQCQSALSFMGIMGHMLMSSSKSILERIK